MESGSDFKQAGHSTSDFHSAFAGLCDTGEDLQESAFARSISANDADYLSTLNIEIDLAQSPKLFYHPAFRGVGLTAI
jgi:hypothetical protein